MTIASKLLSRVPQASKFGHTDTKQASRWVPDSRGYGIVPFAGDLLATLPMTITDHFF